MHPHQDQEALALERTLLAAERTFSAWIRTGLAGVGGGLAVARALVFQSHAHQVAAQAIGVLLVIWGASIFVYAIVDYRSMYQRLTRESSIKRSSLGLTLMTALMLIVCMLVLWTFL